MKIFGKIKLMIKFKDFKLKFKISIFNPVSLVGNWFKK